MKFFCKFSSLLLIHFLHSYLFICMKHSSGLNLNIILAVFGDGCNLNFEQKKIHIPTQNLKKGTLYSFPKTIISNTLPSSEIQSIFSISYTKFCSRVSPSFVSKSEIMLGSHVRGHTPSNSNTYPIRIIQIPAGEVGENNYDEPS